MNKELILGAAFILALGVANGQPVEVTDSSSLDFDIVGGENKSFWMSFDAAEGFGSQQALETRLTVSQDEVTGEEFELYSSLNDVGLESCGESVSTGESSEAYICSFDVDNVEEENNISYILGTNPLLIPGNYDFELSLRTNPGSISADREERNVSSGRPENISVQNPSGNIDISITPDENSTATVESYSTVSAEPPAGKNSFAGGINVEVRNGSKEVSASGTAKFEHPARLQNVEVYYLDDGEWTANGVRIEERGPDYVRADLPHFSTYAAYGEEPEESGSGSSSFVEQRPSNEEERNETEPQTNNTNTETGNTDQEGEGNVNQDDNEAGQNETEPGTDPENVEGPPSDTPTGFFTAESSSVIAVALLAAVLFALILQYTGGYDFRKLKDIF